MAADEEIFKNAATDIVAFSKKRPLWQQDALRRLATQGAVSDTELDDLLKAVKVLNKAIPDELTTTPSNCPETAGRDCTGSQPLPL